MAARDLQGCAKLLSHIMLETDSKQKPPVGQGRFAGMGSQIKKDKVSKIKARKSGAAVRQSGPVKADLDEIDENIQRMIRIKRAQEGHPVLNAQEKLKQEVPERDTGGTNTSGLNAPYNQRLASSTPQGTPVKMMGKASVQALLKGDADEHALNSFEFIQVLNPTVPKEPGPALKQGQVDFQPNPLQTLPPRSAFVQQHLQGMREAYMQNIQSGSSSGKQPHQIHHRHHQPVPNQTTTDKVLMAGLPSTIPAPIVLSSSQPTMYPHASQPIFLSTGPGGVSYAYNLPQSIQHTQHQQPLYPQTSTRQYHQELPERDNAQYSLYSSNETTNADKNDENTKGVSNTNNDGDPVYVSDVGKRPISPFKAQNKKAENTAKESKGCQVSRAEVLQSALKIALDDNGYLKSGPISPFKPGTGGFSGFGIQSQHSDYSHDTTQDTLRQGDVGVQTENVESEDDADSTLIESACSKGNRTNPGISKKATVINRLSKGTASSDVKKVVTKNKKVQFVPGKKKTKEVKARKNGTHGAKVIKSTVKPTKQGTAEVDNKGNKSVTSEVSSKPKAKAKQPVVKDVEEDKENMNPVVEDKEVNTSPSVKTTNYNGLMVKVQHLVKELKAVPGVKLDKEGKRLLKELDETIHAGNLSWQTDLDLTVQPLRSENAQLRRRIRILTQQMKDKEIALQNAEKPDQGFTGYSEENLSPNPTINPTSTEFKVVHLQMKVFNLENELKALKHVNVKLKEEVKVYLMELERMSADRAQMMDLFGRKDMGTKSNTAGDTRSDGYGSRTELDAYKREKREADKERNDMKNEMDLMNVQYKQKEAELLKTQELVRNLQGSMNRLLEELQSTKPCPSASLTRLNRELQEVQAIMDDQNSQKSTPRSATSSKLTRSESLRHSARQTQPVRSRPIRSISADRKYQLEEYSPRHSNENNPEAFENRDKYGTYRSKSQQREPHYNRDGDDEHNNREHLNAQNWKPLFSSKREYDYEDKHIKQPVTGIDHLNRESSSMDVKKYEPVYKYRHYEPVHKIGTHSSEQDGKYSGREPDYKNQHGRKDGDYDNRNDFRDHRKTTGDRHIHEPSQRERHYSADRKHRGEKGIPSTHPTEKVGLFLMDEPGLNYKKMAETLSEGQRVSLSTNPETDITEYQIYPGMSPMMVGKLFEKLDPFIKDLLSSQKMRGDLVQGSSHLNSGTNQNLENRFKSTSESALPGDYKGQVDTQRLDDGKYASGSLQTFHQKENEHDHSKDTASRVSESKETVSSAPTVKELLTPIADRMERFKSMSDVEKSRAVRAINFDQPPPEKVERTNNEKGAKEQMNPNTVVADLDDTYGVDLEGEIDKLQYEVSSENSSTTFSERSDQHLGSDDVPMNNNQSQSQSESRYSVTDYFKKYPNERKPIQPNNGESILEHSNIAEEQDEQLRLDLSSFQEAEEQQSNGSGSLIDVDRHIDGFDPPPGMDPDYWAEKVLISPHGIPIIFDDSQDDGSTDFNSNDAVAHTFRSLRDLQEGESLPGEDGSSPQQQLYQGTDLDTTLSSINELESVDTVTTTASISSVDDRVFRQGLANLDANIARVQQSLRQKMF